MARRVTDTVQRPDAVTVLVNGEPCEAYEGETVATVLFLAGGQVWGTDRGGAPRAPFCNMGVCYDCLVEVREASAPDGTRKVRACMTPITAGMVISTSGSTGKAYP